MRPVGPVDRWRTEVKLNSMKDRNRKDEKRSLCSRREFMLTVSSLAVPLVTGCSFKSREPRLRALTIGLCDALCTQTASECVGQYAEREYVGLVNAVREETDVELQLRPYRLDQQLVAALRTGELDGVVCKTWTLLRGSVASGRPFERLADIPGPTGSKLLRGVFIARKDAPVKALADIDGRRFALGSESQYESSFQARKVLAGLGVQPDKTVTVESCLNAAALVWENEVDAAVVSDYCVDHSAMQLTGVADAFRVIGRTPGVPFVTFAVSRKVPAAVRKRVQACLLGLTGRAAPQDLATAGLIEPIPWIPEELRTA